MKKILIIEDNLEVRENTAEIIELSNYEVITAENGKVGVERALKEIPDLIICDIMMPIMDGYSVYHSLSKHKETAAIPFIFLTAKSEKADFRKGMEMGVDDYIMKPFDGIELLHAIEVRLEKAGVLKEHYSGPAALTAFLEDITLAGKVKLSSDERETFSYNRKQVIYAADQRPRVVYYVISGAVKISTTNDDGKDFVTSIHRAGDYFGYTSILQDINYNDQAQALETTELMLIPREDFIQLITTDSLTATTFIKLISRNIAEKEAQLVNLAYSSLRKKVAYGLIILLGKIKKEEGNPLVVSMSRETMAQSIGIATESLIRTLSDFKEEKLVEIETGKVIILNEPRLKNLQY